MKQLICIILLFYVFAAKCSIHHGHIKICNKTKQDVDVIFHYDGVSKDSLQTLRAKKGGKINCIERAWFHKKHRLRHFNLVSNKNDLFKKSGLHADISIVNEGFYASGRISGTSPYKSTSLIKYDYGYTAHYIKKHQEFIHVNITSVDFNPQGSFIKEKIPGWMNDSFASCNSIVPNQTDDSFSGKCVPNYSYHGATAPYSQIYYPKRYNFTIKGLSVLNQGMTDNTIPQNIDIKNTCEFRSDGKQHQTNRGSKAVAMKSLFVGLYPVGYGKNIPKGSYKKSCPMAYFNDKKKVLYAACSESKSSQFLELLQNTYDHELIWWKNRSLHTIYRVSSLETKHCKRDIKNKNGTLHCG